MGCEPTGFCKITLGYQKLFIAEPKSSHDLTLYTTNSTNVTAEIQFTGTDVLRCNGLSFNSGNHGQKHHHSSRRTIFRDTHIAEMNPESREIIVAIAFQNVICEFNTFSGRFLEMNSHLKCTVYFFIHSKPNNMTSTFAIHSQQTHFTDLVF